jgi:hypothetical protein
MTDFLSNLLLRSAMDQPTVALLQPRLPALFEPQRGADQHSLALPNEIVQETISPSTSFPGVKKQRDHPSTRISPNESRPGSEAVLSLIDPKLISRKTNSDAPRNSDEERQTAPSSPFLEERKGTILSDRDKSPAIQNQRAQKSTSLLSEGDVPSRWISPQLEESERISFQTHLGLTKEEIVEKTPPSSGNTHVPGRLKPVVQQPITIPAHLGEGLHLSSTQTQDRQRVIEIHIGRIEVRATPPTTSGKRSSQPAPKVSLEEYLRARSGEKR